MLPALVLYCCLSLFRVYGYDLLYRGFAARPRDRRSWREITFAVLRHDRQPRGLVFLQPLFLSLSLSHFLSSSTRVQLDAQGVGAWTAAEMPVTYIQAGARREKGGACYFLNCLPIQKGPCKWTPAASCNAVLPGFVCKAPAPVQPSSTP